VKSKKLLWLIGLPNDLLMFQFMLPPLEFRNRYSSVSNVDLKITFPVNVTCIPLRDYLRLFAIICDYLRLFAIQPTNNLSFASKNQPKAN